MITRIDRLGVELPPPSEPDPAGAAAVQELMGGRFGEMSTFMNYTFQSFNFRGRQAARPFYDLIANIAAEEFGHIELVAAAINTMLTDAAGRTTKAPDAPLADVQGRRQPATTSSPAARARCRPTPRRAVDRRLRLQLRRPGRGPDPQLLPRDRRPQRQAQGLRDGRAPGGPRADRLPARPRRRAPGRLRARAGEADRRRPDEGVPRAADPDGQDPRVPAAHRGGPAPDAVPVLDRPTTTSSARSSTARTPRPATSSSSRTGRPRARSPHDLPPQPDVFAPDYAPEDIAEIAQRLRKAAGLPDKPTGEVAAAV